MLPSTDGILPRRFVYDIIQALEAPVLPIESPSEYLPSLTV